MKKIFDIAILIIGITGIILFACEKQYEHEDVNRDGKVDIKDLLLVQKYILSTAEDNGK